MAEVKVKITAQNQTQTGFQAVLADAQKTATQVQNTFARASEIRMLKPKELSSGPISVDIGDYGLEPLRELQKQIADVRRSAREALDPDVAENFSSGIGGLIGRFAILIGVAATVGKVIASAFDRLSESVKSATAIQEQFNESLKTAGNSATLQGAISGFKQLSGFAEQTNKSIKETFGGSVGEAVANLFSGRPGQVLARSADAFTLGSVSSGLQQQEGRQRQIARDNLITELERQGLAQKAIAAAGGDPKAVEEARRKAQRAEERSLLEQTLSDGKFSSDRASLARSLLEEKFQAEDAARTAEERFKSEEKITREKEKQAALESGTRAGNVRGRQLGPGSFEGIAEFERERARALKELGPEFGPGTADAALGGFRVDASQFAREQQEEALKLAQKQAQQSAFAGDFGASALQRVGGASTEFFRVRGDSQEEQQKRSNEFLKQILQQLKNGEPLVLGNSR